MTREIYISYFDGNNSRMVATSYQDALNSVLREDGEKLVVYRGYDNITTVVMLDEQYNVINHSTINLECDAKALANALNIENSAATIEQHREETRLMEARI